MTARHMAVEPSALGRPALNRLPLVALVLSVVALAAGGVVIAVGALQQGASAPATPAPKGPFGVSQDIPTSFGAIAIDNVEKLNGMKAKDLTGMTHFPSYVKPNQVQVQASVSITNLLPRTVDYSPTQFRLLVGEKRKPVDEVRASFRPGTLQPDASVSGQLKFVAPRNGSKLWLEFADPARRAPIVIDLGRTGRTPATAFDGFHRKH
jgi:hypothetical protein